MHQLKSGPAVAGSRKEEEEVLFCGSLFCRPHFGSNGSLYARAARTRSLAATPDEALPAWLPFSPLDAFTGGIMRLRRRRDRCNAHVIGCWYGAAHLHRVQRCPQLVSGHRQGRQVLRCWRTPHCRPQANCRRPRCISPCGKRLRIGHARMLFNSVGASIGSTS